MILAQQILTESGGGSTPVIDPASAGSSPLPLVLVLALPALGALAAAGVPRLHVSMLEGPPVPSVDVLVIGAGLSGLTAAWRILAVSYPPASRFESRR